MGPLGLLGDSRPILTGALAPLLKEAVRGEPADAPAVYLGAANGDDPRHFELFSAAMGAMGFSRSTQVVDDPAPLAEAALVFLAGGDPRLGLRALTERGQLDAVIARHHAGAVLLGSSAGAMLLGARVWDGHDAASITDGAKLVPFAMHAHAEPAWSELRALLALEPGLRGVGLRSGGGAWIAGDAMTSIGAGYVEL